MRLKDIDPGLADQLDPLFVVRLLPAIDYCDQSEAPPPTAYQTHTELFSFHHTAPGHDDEHLYKGLLVYSPPLSSMGLGTFNGTGCLVAHPGQPQAVFQELGTSRTPSPWVRIAIGMRRSALADPEGIHKVFITASFTFLNEVLNEGGGTILGGPGDVERYLETDIVLQPPLGTPGKAGSPPHMALKDNAQGDRGRIYMSPSTVVP